MNSLNDLERNIITGNRILKNDKKVKKKKRRQIGRLSCCR